MNILVTGGAGYIGAHVVWALIDTGYNVCVVDNLSSGSRANLPASCPFYEEDIANRAALDGILAQHQPRAVMHFAGSIVVPESVRAPLLYYRNNLSNTVTLLEAMAAANVPAIIFSSTAAVYGTSGRPPISVDTPCLPANPYGHSKLMCEQVIQDTSRSNGLRYGILRYFNVAGADARLRCGQVGVQVSHLIRIIAKVITGELPELEIYGDDYATFDGTCIRDYLHVSDLAALHLLALQKVMKGDSMLFNAGYNQGYSVKQVVKAAENVAGKPLPVRFGPRREGDVAALVADGTFAFETLGWKPQHHRLEEMIASAIAWEQQLTASRAQARLTLQ